jgi:uncharacterized protein (TIGR00255 family)
MTADSPKGPVHSMTGFGRAQHRTPQGSVAVELRSTNHRFLEIDVRLPAGLASLQGRVAEVVREGVKRGRIEATVSLQEAPRDRRRVALDEDLLERYHAALLGLKGRFGLKGPLTLDHLLALPQAVSVSEARIAPEQWLAPVEAAVRLALKDLERARRREGATLIADIRRQMARIEAQVKAIKRRLPKALEGERKRLREQLRTLLGSKSALSSSVLAQVVALVRDADVHEELVRLDSHLGYMRQTLTGERLVGKRLDFIAQELMREANTTGAKVDDPEAAQHVVEIKGCIEKIREQVQNLE